MKNLVKSLTVASSSLIFLTGCFSSSNSIEGEWEGTSEESEMFNESAKLDVGEDSIEFILTLTSIPNNQTTMAIRFDYEIVDTDGSDYTIDSSDFSVEVLETSSSLEEEDVEMFRDSMGESLGGETVFRLTDNNNTLFWIIEGGDESGVRFKKV
jgi:hypothetical protein